mmetsp:Transcript_5484/g.11590  ORF Transcript_5484/g.11590 Transcript_5484/m.11590 type:complete len:246 (-) Transcript_5484:831-1568(-)
MPVKSRNPGALAVLLPAPGIDPAPPTPPAPPPMARCISSAPLRAWGFIICRTMPSARSGLPANICRNTGFCASSICRIAPGFWSTIRCIICCTIGFSSIAIIWSGSAWVPPGINPGTPPPPPMAAHGFGALLVLLLLVVLLLPREGLPVDDDDGDPQGFGMAAPVDPSRVLLEFPLAFALLTEAPPICASMSGSCMFRYMLERALKPPGMFSICDMASSWFRWNCCIICGFLIICDIWRSISGLS